jgi:peptidoglycan hydrolase CwlO-like protein
MLDRDLEESEEQYQMSLRSHLLNVDGLIDLQDSRLLALENEFEFDLRTLEDEYSAEREQLLKQHTKERTELHDIMTTVDRVEGEKDGEAKQEHEQLREEIRNKNLQDIQELRADLESNIEELERCFESAHLTYLQNTDNRTQDFKHLTQEDEKLSEDIEAQLLKVEKLQGQLAHWRTKINQNDKECDERNKGLEEEKNAIQSHFQELKSRMNKFRDNEGKRLSNLMVNANKSKNTLLEKIGLGERILKQGELARKRETRSEKVLPFYKSTDAEGGGAGGMEAGAGGAGGEGEGAGGVDADGFQEGVPMEKGGGGRVSMAVSGMGETAAVADDPKVALGLNPDGSAVSEWDYLNTFHKRYNKAMLDKIAVQREKERLERENKDLQTILKQYLDGISVNEDVMNSDNPLLVINGRVNLNAPLVGRGSDPAVIEGNHMVNTGRVEGRGRGRMGK